jgi:hypothetical protein
MTLGTMHDYGPPAVIPAPPAHRDEQQLTTRAGPTTVSPESAQHEGDVVSARLEHWSQAALRAPSPGFPRGLQHGAAPLTARPGSTGTQVTTVTGGGAKAGRRPGGNPGNDFGGDGHNGGNGTCSLRMCVRCRR